MSGKYKNSYLEWGFVANGDRPQCVNFGWTGSNESMKPFQLKRHLTSKHPALQHKYLSYFERKRDELQRSKGILKASTSDKPLTKASFLVAEHIAKAKKPFTIGEERILPCAKRMCTEVLGSKAAEKIAKIPLSAETVRRRILDIGEDIEEQLCDKIKTSPKFVVQLDESTDLSNKALILVFVCYKGENDMVEDFLTCDELPGRTTAAEIFKTIDKCVTLSGLDWIDCVGICTDGAAAMTGRHSGVVKLVLDRAPSATWTHCFLHRENLAAKDMSDALDDVMNVSVKTINLLRKNSLNSRLFSQLCNESEAEHDMLLYFASIRWLSRGQSLKRIYELREHVQSFLEEKGSEFADKFKDAKFITTLAYMSDIFGLLNELNTSFQGSEKRIFNMLDKIEGFKLKLEAWKKRIRRGEFDMFDNLQEFLLRNKDIDITLIISDHLSNLKRRFNDYFPDDDDMREQNSWIRDPFTVDDISDVNIDGPLQDQLIDIVADGSMKTVFRKEPLTKFWIVAHKEYPEISSKAINVLLPFTTTYMCEAGFSTVAYIKSKYRNKLQTHVLLANLRVAL